MSPLGGELRYRLPKLAVLGRGKETGWAAGSALVFGHCWVASCVGVGISARMRYSARRASVRTR
jgi:hypothetical protein